ncbi:MAG: hypothetical protein ACFFAU_03330 [Candidatus Hodarchaeota archaeon]
MAVSWISIVGIAIFLIEIIIIAILVISTGRRWKDNRITAIGILFSLHMIFLIFLITEMIFLIFNFSDPVRFYLQERNLLVSLFPFFGGISAGFYLIFIDYFLNERISPGHTLIYGFFLGAFILNIMFKIMFPEIISFSPHNFISWFQYNSTLITLVLSFLVTTNFPASYFVVYVVIVTFFNLSKIKGNTSDVQKRQITFLQMTVLSYYGFTTMIVVVGYVFSNFFTPDITVFLRHLAPHLGVIIGSILIFTSYIRSPAGFLQFHRIEKLMVVSHAGLPLFSYDFQHIRKTKNQDELLSGGVYAILSLFSEMIETKNITKIQFQDKIIALSYQESFIVILLADDITNFLRNALDSFSRMFALKYGLNELQDLSIVSKSVFEDARHLIRLAFSFE